MDRFVIAPRIVELLPRMQVVIVTARNIDNTGSNPKLNEYTENIATTALSALASYPNAQSHPRIALYRNTLKDACNVSAKKFPQSNESLYKRLMKDKKPFRPINPLVDFYNSISVKHAVTAGAFDIASLKTSAAAEPDTAGKHPLLELRLTRDGDVFLALDAPEGTAPTPVPADELAYVQGNAVLTRHLAWRQAAAGLVTPQTTDVVFMSEIFNESGEGADAPSALAQSVADDLVKGLKDFFGVEGKAVVLSAGLGKTDVEIGGGSL